MRIQVGTIRPGHDVEFDRGLTKNVRIGKGGENTFRRVGAHARKIDDAGGAIPKSHGKATTRQYGHRRNAPRRGRDYSNGGIRFGSCFD
jgi:hypothetical protein